MEGGGEAEPSTPASPTARRPWYRRGWLRAAIGAAVLACLGGGAAAGVLLTRGPAQFSVQPQALRLLLGHHHTLHARFGGGPVAARWRSSAPAVITVSRRGRVEAIAAGSATVTASAHGDVAHIAVRSLGIRALHLRVPGTIGYGQVVPVAVRETLTDGSTPRRAPLPVRVRVAANGPLSTDGATLLGTRLGLGAVVVRGPDGPSARELITVAPSVPTNSGTVTHGFVPHAPLAVQIDDGPTSDPHTGVQAADIVYEYATEGGITRFTAVYWHLHPSTTVGPTRSARLILIQVQRMYHALAVFSGASNGTYANLIHDGVPMLTDDCCGQDFYRTSDHVAPSNLFTNGKLLLSGLRSGFPQLAHEHLPYLLIGAHVDHQVPGPIRTVTIDQTPVNVPTYHYNPVSRRWERWVNGTPQIDTATGRPIAVRNLIVLSANWHYTNYVEDVLGNHSIYWDLTSSGPFQAFIDGRAFHGTWHRSANGGPILYTDADGLPLPLATGLTWVEVVAPGTTVSVAS